MTDIIATAVILVCVGATFCATCYAIARFAYFDRRARADLLLAFYCVVVFAGAVVGCLAFTDAYGNVASAVFRSPSVRMLGSGRRASAENVGSD